MKVFIQILFVLLCLQQSTAQIFINEVQTSNDVTILDNFLESDDWIELYNPTGTPIDLAGYYISDDGDDLLQHQIIAGDAALTTIPANGYLLFWADNDVEQGINHLNFKLKSGGETIYLTSSDQVSLIDSLQVLAVATDETYFRKPDGTNNLHSSPTPTPATSNNNVTLNLSEPAISLPGGIYNGTETVSIAADAGATIYYTTDGSAPTTNSTVYNGSFNIDNSATVKAFATKAGYVNSNTVFESYIFDATTNLSIVNVSIDPAYLFDDQTGMYVEGTNGILGMCTQKPRNWWQDWEYEATIALYEKNGEVAFNEACGIKISGGCGRNKEKKSFNIKFKNEYGKSTLNYKMFEDSDADIFDGFKLRSGKLGNRIDDVFPQSTIANQMDIDLQYSRPVALYLNGEYWGLYYIRDRMNAGYLQTHHPKVDHDNVDFIKWPNSDGLWWEYAIETVSKGDNIAYQQMHNFAVNNDLSIDANYKTATEQIDVNELINYLVCEIYLNNSDWPENNIKVWRERTEKAKWRWGLFDLDRTAWTRFGGFSNTALLDEFLNNMDPTERRNPKSTELYRSLFKNDSFRNEFIQRMNTYAQTVWNYDRTNPMFDELINEITPEMKPEADRWETGLDFDTWSTSIYEMDTFFKHRPIYARKMIKNVLGLGDSITLNFKFDDSTNGSLMLHQNFFEVPYNFSGLYFKDVEMHHHAIPKPGYRFVQWNEISDIQYKYNQNIYKSFGNNKTLTPVFEPALDVVINEIYYNPAGTKEEEEFIEIYNPDDKAKSLWGYQFTDGVEFQFPKNTVIQPGEYIVIANNDSAYVNKGYQVFEWEGGSLNNDGESIVFANPANEVIDSVYYNDNSQWNQSADGLGFSLALLIDVSDNNLPTSWEEQVSGAPVTPGSKNDFCGIGSPCDDGDPNSIEDAIDVNCNCIGIIEDACNTIINFENFETGWGIWNDGGADAIRTSNSTYAASGTFSAGIQDNTNTSIITTNNLNLTTYNAIEVNFNYYAVSMDNANEDFWLQVSTNGGSSFSTVQTWARSTDFNNNTAYTETINIQGPFTADTKIRFRCDASGNVDDIYLDDIEILGCAAGGGNNCATVGQTCNDDEVCTTSDQYDVNCNCVGTPSGDSDNDGICDATDNTNGNCSLNAACDDGDPCTVGETYDANCNCNGGSPVVNNSANSLTPTDDAFIRGGTFGDNNYGSSNTIQVKKAGNDKWTRYGYLKFDLSSVDANQLQNAKLRLKVQFNNAGSVAQKLLNAPTDNWTESNLTWNNIQPEGASISNFIAPALGQWVEIDITSAVRTEAIGDGILSLAIMSDNSGYVRYYSKESSGNQPELVLTYQSCNNRIGQFDEDLIEIFPNPSSDFVNIEMNERIKREIKQISIYSVAGKLMHTKSTDLSQRIFVGDLTPGLYILKAEGLNKIWNSKFLKQ